MARRPSTKERATYGKRYCANDRVCNGRSRTGVNADAPRAHAILAGGSKWLNQTVLHYCFFKSGHFSVPKAQADAVRQAFAAWKAVGIGLEFAEVKSAQRGRGPDRLLRCRRLVGVGRRPRRAAGSAQRADDGVRLEPDVAVRPGNRAPRARPCSRHGARASEPLRRDQVARAGGLRQPGRTAEQLGPLDHLPQHPGEAHSATGAGVRHGIPTRSWSTSSIPV